MASRYLNNIKINDAYTFPSADGTSGQVITANGDGTLSFADPAVGDSIALTVKNVSGGTLSKGTVVHASPTASPPSGNVIEVIAADYDTTASMPAIGILNEQLTDDSEGSAIMFGRISGIDTSSFSAGDEVYVGNAGALTATKPTGTNYIQKMGVIIKSHASSGTLEVFGAGRTNDVPTPLHIDHSNQRLGIGTSSPSGTLDVNSGTGNTVARFVSTDIGAGINIVDDEQTTILNQYGNSFKIQVDKNDLRSNSNFRVDVDGSEAFRVIADGKMGIGTTSPEQLLHLYGSGSNNVPLKIESAANTSFLHFVDANTTADYKVRLGSSGDNLLAWAGGAERMRITSTGNVGIGTTSPSRLFHVNSSGQTDIHLTSTTQGTTSSDGMTVFLDAAGSGGMWLRENNSLRFATNSTERMRVDSSGNVGIGETSIDAKLHLSAASAGLINQKFESTGSAAWRLGIPANQTYFAFDNSNDDLSSPKLVIDSSGKVGIGSDSPEVSLDLGNNTDAIRVPNGSTADRPSGVLPGMIRYNTTTNEFEGYSGTLNVSGSWGSLGGGGGTVNVERNSYTGDGSDLTFDTTSTIDNENNVQVYVDGVYQSKTKYSTSGNTVTFASGNAPANGAAVELIHHKGDTGATIAANAIDTTQIVDDAVTFDKIEDRYTAVGTITNTSGATTVDWSSAAVYKMNAALTAAIEFDFTNYKAGQVLTIYNLSGSYTVTLDSDAATSESFLKLAEQDYDGSVTSMLQVECLADGNDAVFVYSVAQYASDTTI